MFAFTRGGYRVRFSDDPADAEAAQRLRHQAFVAARGIRRDCGADARDADEFDPLCRHALIEQTGSGRLVGCFRIMRLADGAEIARSYAARHYELSALRRYPAPMIEMGRFCLRPGHGDPDALRIAWGAMTRYVEQSGVELLFGCSSFEGVEADAYADAFAYLRARHMAPRRWRPQVKAPRVIRFGAEAESDPASASGSGSGSGRRLDPKQALRRMPPLLRSYLAMGGWVSDHAVIDCDLNTLHVFTGVEISRVPPRRRALMRLAS